MEIIHIKSLKTYQILLPFGEIDQTTRMYTSIYVHIKYSTTHIFWVILSLIELLHGHYIHIRK